MNPTSPPAAAHAAYFALCAHLRLVHGIASADSRARLDGLHAAAHRPLATPPEPFLPVEFMGACDLAK